MKTEIHLAGPLPATPKRNQYILTIQCIFSKNSDANLLKIIDFAKIKVIEVFCNILQIGKVKYVAYHPQILGSLERSHHTLIEYLQNFGNSILISKGLIF